MELMHLAMVPCVTWQKGGGQVGNSQGSHILLIWIIIGQWPTVCGIYLDPIIPFSRRDRLKYCLKGLLLIPNNN